MGRPSLLYFPVSTVTEETQEGKAPARHPKRENPGFFGTYQLIQSIGAICYPNINLVTAFLNAEIRGPFSFCIYRKTARWEAFGAEPPRGRM